MVGFVTLSITLKGQFIQNQKKKKHKTAYFFHAEGFILIWPDFEIYVFEAFAAAEVKHILLVVLKNDIYKTFFFQNQYHFYSE